MAEWKERPDDAWEADDASASEHGLPGEYRAISIPAVGSLLLGISSMLAFTAPGAWLLPGLAVLAGGFALVRIHFRSDLLKGRRIAWAGLASGLFFLTAAPVHYFANQAILAREGRAFVTEWLEALRDGDLDKAHQAVLAVRERQPQGTILADYYRDDEQEALDRTNFFAEGIYRTLRDAASGATIRFDRTVGVEYTGSLVFVNQRYYLDPPQGGKPLHIQTTAIREVDAYGVYWVLAAAADVEEVEKRERHRRH